MSSINKWNTFSTTSLIGPNILTDSPSTILIKTATSMAFDRFYRQQHYKR